MIFLIPGLVKKTKKTISMPFIGIKVLLEFNSPGRISKDNDIPVIESAFPVIIKSIIQEEFPGDKQGEKEGEKVFNILPRIIGERSDLEIDQEQEEEKDNDLDVGE
jgi:hypothetical protein